MTIDLTKSAATAKTSLLRLEQIAADVLERAQATGDTATYQQAVQYQRAAHVAYDVINIEPDAIDTVLGQQQPAANAIRTGWIRWLTNASDAALLRFHKNIFDLLDRDDTDSDETPAITPSA